MMCNSARRLPRLACVLLAGWVSCGPVALASCLDSGDPGLAPMEILARSEPAKAVRLVGATLEGLREHLPADEVRLAGLYSVLADANEALELDRDARAAAAEGLKHAPRAPEGVRVNLLSALALNVYDVAGLKEATGMINSARNAVTADSRVDVCLQITAGSLLYRQDQDDLAMQHLTNAYRVSTRQGWQRQRVLAAEGLSHVFRNSGEFDQALSLNQEVIDWAEGHHQDIDLSVGLYMRGEILRGMGRPERSITEYEAARRISRRIEDGQGVAFSDLRTCQAQIDLKRWSAARTNCNRAQPVFVATQAHDMLKEVQANLARIDLAQGHAARALPVLDEVLSNNGDDVPPRRAAALFELRARTLAALGRYQEAFVDLNEYAHRNAREADAERIRQSAALRARFDTDREVERNATLKNQLALEKERVSRQNEQLRWTIAAILAGACVIALLTYILIAGQRHRRQLVDLASHDGLTGLPNRRRSVEVATQALSAAASGHRPLTIGLIDLDYFKMINDRHGHAVGDAVLREFARIGRETLRGSDFLGRWGGEEFILVLPDMTLDVAMLSIERMRTAALQIPLPEGAEPMRVSFSAGLASNDSGVNTLDEIIAQADVALYEAKSNGRDLVKISPESLESASTGVRRALRRSSRAAQAGGLGSLT
ncbi:MAG: GGDEF domain-containing protein [Steroidobacteraceae bacterium]